MHLDRATLDRLALNAALAQAEKSLSEGGIPIGAALMAPPQGFTVGQNILWSLAQLAKMWLFVLVPLFLLAGLIEGLISPLVIVALYGG